jgi:hypothetical protein
MFPIRKMDIYTALEFAVAPELAADRQHLWADWNNLEPYNYLKDGARFRLRQLGLCYLLPSTWELPPLPPAPYFQPAGINANAGGIEPNFAALLDATLADEFQYELIKFSFCQSPVDSQMSHKPWEIEVHQSWIVAAQDEQGEPTPEGTHRDGDDLNAIHLIRRQYTTGGIGTVCDNGRNLLASCMLRRPMDSMLAWEPRVMHGVTPTHSEDPSDQPSMTC